MPAKVPAEKFGVPVTFRYPRKKSKNLEKLAKTHGFKNKSNYITWCLKVGEQILNGDFQYVETILSQFQRPEDPRQQDLWDSLVVKSKAEVYNRLLQALEEVPEALEETVQSHLSSQK